MAGSLRFVSILSLLTVIFLTVIGGMWFRTLATNDLQNLIEKGAIGRTQAYVDNVWKNYRDVIVPLAATDPSQLKARPEVIQFAQDTVKHFKSLPLVKVNIYSAQGLLLMTTTGASDLRLTSASPDSNFVSQRLKNNQTTSQVLHNVTVQNGPPATLVQSLVPMHLDNNPNLDGAVEFISDLTPQWQHVVDFQIDATCGISVMFLVFLSLLFLVSRRSENIIAKQHEANLDLAQAAASAQAENREKSQFLANISHELRTPLNAIIGFSDILKTEVMATLPDKKYHNYITDINSSGVHLLSLINDILDYSKAEAGKLELEVAEVNATKLIQNCMRMVSPRAEAAKVKLAEDLPKEPIVMVIDNKKFKQVLLNLLSNSVKFTPAGGEVRICGWRNATEDTYTFEVKDTGIGIAPKDISRAMAPFGQVESNLDRKYEGTGLGLPLTKKFVELMGGKFGITSEVNVGTTITFTLPRETQPREGLVIKQAS